jgi:hypothetical protein
MSTNTTKITCVAQASPLQAIDRIDGRGNIREHITADGQRALCGALLGGPTQEAAGNAKCGSCAKMVALVAESLVVIQESPAPRRPDGTPDAWFVLVANQLVATPDSLAKAHAKRASVIAEIKLTLEGGESW